MLPALSPLSDSAQAEARPCCGSAPLSRANAPVNDNATPDDVQKRTRGSSRVSPSADKLFLNEHKALSGILRFDAPAQSAVPAIVSVSEGYDLSASLYPLPHTTKTPRHWRDATDEIQAHFALEALRESGPVIAFTAWCSAEIDAKARATGAPLPWLRNRLRKALGNTLGAVEWLVAVEEEKAADGKLLLHLHGAGAFGDLTRSRRKEIRRAFQRALGAWEGPAARYQIKLGIARDTGWAGYCTKRAWLAQPGIRAFFTRHGARPGSQWCISFNGPVLTMTNGIRARAKELHQEARRIVLEARQRAKAIPSSRTAREAPGAACEFVSETVKPTSKRASAQCRFVANNLLDGPALRLVSERPRPIKTARSRDPPDPWP